MFFWLNVLESCKYAHKKQWGLIKFTWKLFSVSVGPHPELFHNVLTYCDWFRLHCTWNAPYTTQTKLTQSHNFQWQQSLWCVQKGKQKIVKKLCMVKRFCTCFISWTRYCLLVNLIPTINPETITISVNGFEGFFSSLLDIGWTVRVNTIKHLQKHYNANLYHSLLSVQTPINLLFHTQMWQSFKKPLCSELKRDAYWWHDHWVC